VLCNETQIFLVPQNIQDLFELITLRNHVHASLGIPFNLLTWGKRKAAGSGKQKSILRTFVCAVNELRQDTSQGPNVYGGIVKLFKENNFWRSVPTRGDVVAQAARHLLAEGPLLPLNVANLVRLGCEWRRAVRAQLV
jgi:hypothetical protein